MILVVCPNLAIDRILEVDHFQSAKVQRSRSVFSQPGGKGSNVARVFKQLGGEVALTGFVGKANAGLITEPLRRLGIHVDAVTAYEGESRTCTVVCDRKSRAHPTVINEETPAIEPSAPAKLFAKIRRWMPRVDAVLATGSISTGLPVDFYAEVLDYARRRGKLTAIDATGAALRDGLRARPTFMKPNTEEFFHLARHPRPSVFTLAPHTALTLGNAGAVLIYEGECVFATPPRIFDVNPIGAGDSFAAAYLHYLLRDRHAFDCFRFALAAAASDVSTLRPGFVDISKLQALAARVELRFHRGPSLNT